MDCLFCKIAKKEIAAKIVSESARWMSFRDIHPQAPTHILVVPKRHVASVAELDHKDNALLGDLCIEAKRLAESEKISEKGYRLVLNAGDDGGQTVPHLHVHLLGGRRMHWPPG